MFTLHFAGTSIFVALKPLLTVSTLSLNKYFLIKFHFEDILTRNCKLVEALASFCEYLDGSIFLFMIYTCLDT